MKHREEEFLKTEIEHFDLKEINTISLLNSFAHMSFQARNLANAARIFDLMIKDSKCSIILCLAGSLFSAGLKNIVVDLINSNMVDVIVSTGANIVDQDFFEAIGFKHYNGKCDADDSTLYKMGIDRIYDTYIREKELRICDMKIAEIAGNLHARPFSSREFICEIGKYLDNHFKNIISVVLAAYKNGVPIFVPAFSDCSAGLGLAFYQYKRNSTNKLSIDSIKDFLELTKIKMLAEETGLVIIGGGSPKNFAQDTTVSVDILGEKSKMHKYAIQISVADERDGALSGSSIIEAHSWGKVDILHQQQMVFCEATIAFPLITSYVYHQSNWRNRSQRNYNSIFTVT